MLESKLLVYRMPASRAQVWITSSVALTLLSLLIATLFFRTQLFQTLDVEINRASADRASTGERDPCSSAAGNQRT